MASFPVTPQKDQALRAFLVVMVWQFLCPPGWAAPPLVQKIAARRNALARDSAQILANEEIQVGKTKRQFRLVVPKSVDLQKPAPLVIAFHGMLIDSNDVMPLYTKLDDLAVEKKFLIVYPEAIGKSWGLAPDKVQADIAFFDALLAEIQKRHQIDAKRIFVLGMSNGGYFAHLIARERSTTIAAACSHSGPLGLQTLLGIRAERKFPVMIVHGDKDSLFPVAFARENRDKYQREKHPVTYVEVPGLNHQWATAAGINGKIWEFFAEHPLEK